MQQENLKLIAKALIKSQQEMGTAKKDSSNPFFKSKYADLNSIREACMPVLNANGIAVLQPIVNENGKNYVKTLLLHESGESIESMTEIIYNKQNDAQAQGSGITYARRYGLQSLVNIGADDDDGNKASQPASVKVIEKPFLLENSAAFPEAKKFVSEGGLIEDIKKKYQLTDEIIKKLTGNG